MMFTGIVEARGQVNAINITADGARLEISFSPAAEVGVGDSVSINGTCLTAVEVSNGSLAFEVVNESLDRTNLGDLEAGHPVNIERAMPASGRFDGHIVQGHVDATVAVRSIESDGDGIRMWFDAEAVDLRYLVEKGSVTLDGVSLTVAGLDDAGFSIALIRHTLKVTTLGTRQVGDRINLEVDVLAKYIERLMAGEK